MSIKETYDFLRQKAEERGLISQKDLLTRWGLTVRAVQRTRKEFGLEPADFYGVNPLFREEDILRVEKLRHEKRKAAAQRRAREAKGQIGGVLTMKQLRKIKRQHGKGLSK